MFYHFEIEPQPINRGFLAPPREKPVTTKKLERLEKKILRAIEEYNPGPGIAANNYVSYKNDLKRVVYRSLGGSSGSINQRIIYVKQELLDFAKQIAKRETMDFEFVLIVERLIGYISCHLD
jgi:hypothetical protein